MSIDRSRSQSITVFFCSGPPPEEDSLKIRVKRSIQTLKPTDRHTHTHTDKTTHVNAACWRHLNKASIVTIYPIDVYDQSNDRWGGIQGSLYPNDHRSFTEIDGIFTHWCRHEGRLRGWGVDCPTVSGWDRSWNLGKTFEKLWGGVDSLSEGNKQMSEELTPCLSFFALVGECG